MEDNLPYGKIHYGEINDFLFQNHPYKNTVIGSMEDLDEQHLNDFMEFKEKWYVPSNATLVISGNIQIDQTKKMIDYYFSDLPKTNKPAKKKYNEPFKLKLGKADVFDSNITTPALVLNYRLDEIFDKSIYLTEIISKILTGSKTSRLNPINSVLFLDQERELIQVFKGRYLSALPIEGL